jgi:A/G-specific adenine glycosylase
VSEANENELLSYWQGLGYYSRCRNFQKGVRFVLQNRIPGTPDEWRKVPGVGPYTAAAISSICFGEPVGSVDGNFSRVFARMFANSSSPTSLLKEASAWAKEQICTASPGDWNQAIMELGATVCIPKSPNCMQCPIREQCKGKSRPEKFPSKSYEPKSVNLFWASTIYFDGKAIGLEKIPPGKWWNGMFRFPTQKCFSDGFAKARPCVRSTVTHHKIFMSVEVVEGDIPNFLERAPIERISDWPIPALYSKAVLLAFKEGLISVPRYSLA